MDLFDFRPQGNPDEETRPKKAKRVMNGKQLRQRLGWVGTEMQRLKQGRKLSLKDKVRAKRLAPFAGRPPFSLAKLRMVRAQFVGLLKVHALRMRQAKANRLYAAKGPKNFAAAWEQHKLTNDQVDAVKSFWQALWETGEAYNPEHLEMKDWMQSVRSQVGESEPAQDKAIDVAWEQAIQRTQGLKVHGLDVLLATWLEAFPSLAVEMKQKHKEVLEGVAEIPKWLVGRGRSL